MEREKIIEDLEMKANELAVTPDAAVATEEIESAPFADENEVKAQTEQKSLEVYKPEQQESDDASMIDKTNTGHMLDRFELIPDKRSPFSDL